MKRLSELPFEVLDKRSFDLTGGVKAVKATLYRGDSTLCVPVVTFTPPNPTGIPVLYLAYSRDRKDLAGRVEKFLAAGAEVTVADLRASGETWKGYHTFCGAGWDGEEELSMMYTWLGENLVARRTEDALVAASYAAASSRFRSVIAVASGVMAVPAAHAFYLERQLFYSIKFEDPCASWRKVIDDPQQDFRYAAAVYGAFKHYDWPDLVEAAHPECVPELMRMADGRPVETREMWEKERRPELLKIFTERMYGVRPEEKPRSLKFKTLSPDRSILGGAGVSRKVRATYEGTKGTNSFDFTLYLPSSASAKAPVPAFVMICLRKETAESDPESDVELREQWPVAEILRRGYATAGFHKDQLSPDMDHANLLGVFSVYEEMKPYRSNSRWGTLSAWAWGASRVMDYLETVPEIDSGHVAVVGHSRGGKTALLTGVTDTRFAMACSNDSGCGGAKLNHMRLGNSEHFSQIVRTFPYWFCPDFTLCVNRDDQIDFDQHEFIALIAPRLVCVASASEDAWAGPRGEFESARLASPAWKLYGLEGLGDDAAFPAPGGRVMKGCIEYHLREGKHRITDYDWGRYMDFADFHGWRKR